MKFTNFILDTLFPKHCLGCKKYGTYFCDDCFGSVPINQNLACYFCDRLTPNGQCCDSCRRKNRPFLDGLLIATSGQKELVRELIHKFKYKYVKELSAPLAELMINFLKLHHALIEKGKIILVPVPLFKRRLRSRGFNQSDLLAEKISEHFGLEKRNDALIRHRHTRPQMTIKDAALRRQAIKDAFSSPLPEKVLTGKTIILVDDIATTSATLQECAKALEPLGPKKILGLVLCRG